MKWWAIGGAAVVVLVLVLQFAKKKDDLPLPVPCINPVMPLTQHIHAMLQIVRGEKLETVAKNIGISATCETALHTHDTTGTLHVEAQDRREYTLGDFFQVWGRPLIMDSFVKMTIDGEESAEDPTTLKLEEGQQIILYYSK